MDLNLKTKFSSNTVIVFDFDGTIADSFGTVIKILGELSNNPTFKNIVPREQMEQLRNEGIRKLIKTRSVISMAQLPFWVRRFRQELNNKLSTTTPIKDISEVINSLKNKYKIAIISSNAKENIEIFLKNNGINVDYIYSGSSIFGKSKVINVFIKKEKINRGDVIYIGDEDRDIEAAHKSHIFSIAVSWGYNSEKVLIGASPNILIKKPEELISIFLD
ncbi:MAG: HAD-IA family hydrolase [Patescibacteria group bacterium]